MANDKYSQNRQLAYDLLKQEGYTDIGDSAEELFKNKANGELAYKLLSEAGYTDIGKDYGEFSSMLYGPETDEKAVTAAAPVRTGSQRRADRFNEFVRQREAAKGRVAGEETAAQEAAGKAEVEKRMASQAERIARTNERKEEPNAYADYDYNALAEEYARKKEEYAPLISEYEAKMNVNLSSPEDFVTSSWLGEHNTEYNKAVGDLMAIGSEMASRPEYKSQESAIMEATDASDEAIKTMRKDGRALNGELAAARLMNKKTRQLASQPYSDGGKKDALGYLGGAIWDYGKGTLDRVKTAEWLSRGLTKFVEGVNLRPLQEKIQKMEQELKPYEGTEDYDYMASSLADDRLTEEDKVLLASYLNYGRMMELRENNVPLEYRGGQMFADTAGYMLDFLLTRRVDAVGRNAMAKALGKWAPATLFGKGVKAGALELGGAFTRTLSMVPQNLGQIGDSMTEIENVYDESGNVDGSRLKRSVAGAVADGLAKQFIEVASEGSGEIMQKSVGTVISRYFKQSAIPKTIIGRQTREFLRGAGGLIRRGQFQGMGYEDLEEILGATANVALGKLTGGKIGDEDALRQTLSKEAQQEMLLGFLPLTAVSTLGSLKAASRMQADYDEGMRKWEGLVQAGAGVTDEDLNGVVDGLENKSTEDLMKSVANINDKIRKSGVDMPETEVRDMMNKIIAGRLAYDLQGELWENSEDRMALANAYAGTYGMPVEGNLYDIEQTVGAAEAAAKEQGFTDEELDKDASVLMLEAEGMEERGGREADRAETLKAYAMAKAQRQGITDGYDRETADLLRAYEEPILNLADNDGILVVAQDADGQEVYVASKDAVVNADGSVSAPTGPDGLLSILYGNGTTAAVKANTIAGAQQVDTEAFLMDREYEFNEERRAEYEAAMDTISPRGKAEALSGRAGQTVFVTGNGAYEPVRVERMTQGGAYAVISGDREALKGIATALGIQSPGGTMLEVPTAKFYDILAKDEDGSLSTDVQEGMQEEEPQETPVQAENGPESLVDTRQTISYRGQSLDVTVLDVSDGKVIFEDGDGITDSMPVNEFYSRMQGQAEPAPATEPAPAPAPAAEPEQAPAEPAVSESGIPIDEETGEPVYDAEGVTPQQAYDDIYGRFGEDTSDADSFVVEQSDAANKALKKAQKASEKADKEKAEIDGWKRNPGEGLNAFAKRKAEAKAKVDEKAAKSTENLSDLQRRADFWNELREVAEANIAEAKAEAERQKLIEQYGVDTSGFNLEPQTMEEALADGLAKFFKGGGRLSLGSVLDLVGWNMLKDLRKGGYGFVLSRRPEAVPVDKFVMSVADEYPGLIKDEQDATNAVGDLLVRNTRGELGQFIFNNRLEEARRQAENEETPVEEPVIEEAPVMEETVVEEPQAPAEEQVEEAPAEAEEDMPEEIVEEETVPEAPAEEAPVAEPEPAPATEVQEPAQEIENTPENPSESPEISVTSQEGEKGGESTYGSSNKVVSKERYEELRKKMLAKIKGQANAGFDPEIFAMGVEMAAYHIEAGARKFVEFAKRMIADLTDAIRPYLKGIYNGARDLPGMEEYKKEMTPVAEVDAIDINADFNTLSDEQDDNADIQQGEGGVSEPVADTDGGGSEEEPGGDVNGTDSGTPAEDGGEGGDEVGELDGGDGGESAPGPGRAAADGTPGRGGRRGSKSDDGGSTGRGTRRNRGPRQGESGGNQGAGLHTDVGESAGHGNVETEEQKEAKAKAAEQAAYEAEKEAIKGDKDTKALKERKDAIKEQLLGITDKYDLNRAKLAGQLRAILERLRELFSHNLNKSDALAQEKVPYNPVSDPTGKHAIGSVVPSGAADYMRDAVKRLEAEVKKPVAQYVQDELGYKTLDDMFSDLPNGKFDGLSSEQVDAVGLAIHQMKTGRVFIVGDMTGVGKGRVGASLIRWGLRNKKKVIFCTEKPGLFSSMVGDDLVNIGSPNLVPFIVNNDAGANITNEDGVVLVRHPAPNVYSSVYASGKDELPIVASGPNKGRQYDFVMTTYSQLQATEEEEEGDSEKVKKKNERNTKGRQRLNWLKTYAKDAIIVMDESHTAAGEGSTRSENAKKLVEVAQGVTFMSATFAKTPESMGLYAIRSSMNDAMITRDQLIAAISKYGIPMQEILAASLFKTGEMVRRERDFDGVKTNWMSPEESYTKDEIETTRSLSDKTVGVINAIIDFQRRYVDPVIRKMNEAMEKKNLAEEVSGKSDIYVSEYASTPYSGQVSNVVGMMLFALKAKKAAEIAIKQIKNGEKPVIAVDNTLGAYVDQIEGNIESADFGAVLMKGLAFALRYQLTTKHKKLVELPNGLTTYKEVPGDKKVEKYDSILELLGESGSDAVDELERKIEEYGKETLAMDLPLSPIDYIEKKIEDAGYRCGEITQRANALVQNEDGTWSKKPINHKKAKEVVRMFNGGMAKKPLPKEETYDAVVMNRSGATGNSMHAYAKYADQRPRKMIILQAAKDPNNEVQIRGRIDRTGQVHRGEYFYVISPIPAEKKITMMLKQKLASLDANSVGSEKVSSNRVDAEDMDNKYGDEVARDFLVDHEEIHFQMDPSKQMKKSRKTGEYVGRPGLLYDLLLNMQRMTCAEQEMILTELEEAYAQKIEYLNQNGINDLATTTMNLEATTVDSAIMVKGKDNESLSEFAHDTTIERVEVNVLRKPLRSEDIWNKVKELGGLEKHTKKNVWGEEEDQTYGEYIQQRARDAVDSMQVDKKQKLDAALAKLREDVKAETPQPPTMTDEQYEAAIDNDPRIASMTLKNMNEYSRYESQTQEQLRYLRQATDFFRPGRAYLVPLNESEGAQNMYGRFLGYKVGKDARPKSIEAMFATKDSRAMVSIPVVNMHKVIDAIRMNSGGWFDLFGKNDTDYGSEEARLAEYDKWWDKMIPENTSRAIRYMITGNILQSAGSLAAYRGTITTFTRKDAETGEITIDKGLLLAEDFDPENFMVRTEVTKEDVWNNPGEFKDDLTNISAHRDGDQLVVKFTRPRGSKAKLANHPVMTDDEFKALCEGGEIIPYGQDELRAVISEQNASAALDYLYKNYGFTQGHLLVLPDSTERPDRIVYSGKPYKDVIEELKPKYRVYGADGAQRKIEEELKTYKMDITNEDIKNRIRELVQLRQAYLRRDNSNVDDADLAWNVIMAEEQAEKYAKPDPTGETPEAALERKRMMNHYRNLAEAFKEELESRGFEKGHLKHFKQGQTDLDTIINTFNEFNSDKKNAEIAKKVFAIQRLLNVNFFFNEKIHGETGGETAGDYLGYNWRFMNEDWIPDQLKADTILHEMIHTATSYAVNAVNNGSDHLIPGLADAANQANALYSAIYRNKAFRHQNGESSWDYYTDYGAKYNSKEMLCETGSNQQFRDDLKKVKVLVQQQTSFGQTSFSFTDVTDNDSVSGNVMTALDAAMDILNRMIDGFNPDGYRKMWAGSGYGQMSYREAGTPKTLTDAERDAASTTLDRMGEELGVKVNKVSRSEMPTGHSTDKGYYNPKTGEMTICMDNVTDERDAIATVLHETVGHKGLRELFGPRFREAMTNIYASLDRKGRAWVNGYIARHGLGFGEEGIVHGMEEYLAHLAETGDFKNTVWDRIKEIIGKIVDLVFGTDGFVFTDRELNYILRASYEHLKNPNWLNTVTGRAKDTVMKRELGINETDPNRPTDPDGPGTGLRFRDGETGFANEDYNDEMDLWHNKMLIENQNADLPVKIGMEKVMKETGKSEIRDDEDYLTRHNLASSRAESEAHNFELFHFTPLLESVRAIREKLLGGKTGKDARQKEYERILDYIYAVSGLERNEYKNNEIEQQKQEALAILNDPETANARIAAEMRAHPEKYNTPSEIKALADKIDKRIEKEKEKTEVKYDAMKRDWSGITSLTRNKREDWQKANADAQALVDGFKAAVGQDALLDELWDRIRSCTDFSLEHAYKYGLLTREEFERLRGTDTQPRMWDHYVPLRGFNEDTAEEVFDYASFLSPSNDSAVVKKMKGRWTQADNPLANILNIAESEIVQGNDNWAKQALYRFTLDAGENTLLTQVEPWYVKNPATGTWTVAEPEENESLEKFEARMRALADMDTPLAKKGRRGLRIDKIMANKAHRNEHMIRLKVRGVEKGLWVNGNPALAKAVTGVGRAQNMQWLRRASRVLSNLFTTYSLDFSVKNLIRDTIYSRTALIVKEDRAYRRQFAKNWRRNFGYGAFAYPMVRLAAAWESGRLQSKPESERTKKEQMFIDFMTDGGQTGYTIINSVNEIKRDLERSMRRGGKDVGGVTVPILGHYAKAVKTLNEGFELLTRFTAYETSRDMGRSGQRSASDAKEISVNFNRRGAQSGEGVWGNIAAYLGATHYFYNAGVQGFDNFLRLFKISPKKMTPITAGIVMMGILTPLINSMLAASGGGDDDWYWNLPEWVRRNNLVLGTGRTYLAIPLPVEFRAIYGIGDIAAAAFCYQKYPNRTFGRVAGDMISTASGILPVNPVEGYTGNGNIGDAIIRAVAPDAGMFFVDWATNRDYTGRPLWKENPFSETVPKSQGAYASTPKGIVNACQKLAEISAGAIDVPPGLVRDFMNNYGGGFFRAAEDVSKIMTGVIGKDPERPFRWDNVPFFSGFTGHIDEDRSNSFATNALREYKDISEGVVRKVNAICNTKDITAAMVYGDKELPEQYASKVRVQRILSGRDYVIGKEYRDGMNNQYKMKQYVRGDKAGQWYKSREVERLGVDSLKKAWREAREAWAAMPDGTQDEKSAKAKALLDVEQAWHEYYDAEGNLAEKLMNIEYGKQ